MFGVEGKLSKEESELESAVAGGTVISSWLHLMANTNPLRQVSSAKG